jgi:hypothetical protein
MKRFFFSFSAVITLSATAAFAQTQGKGIDSQTQRIRQDSHQTATPQGNTTNRSFSFGKDKTKVREPLANPYRLTARRDVLVNTIIEILKENKIVIDEAASRVSEGFIVTQPFVFAKGSVTARSELSRYAVLPSNNTVWSRGRFTLVIEVQPLDGIQHNVSVTAKVEGRAENGIGSEWLTLQSSGVAEDEILVSLVESVTGQSVDAQIDQ